MIKLTYDKLSEVSNKLLLAVGASEEEATIVSKTLTQANLCGVDSHGILRLVDYVHAVEKGGIKLGVTPRIIKESPCTGHIDGCWGFGQLVATKSMEIAIEKANRDMVAIISAFNCNHVGRLADYTVMAAEKDLIGIMAAKGDPCVAPFGGRKAIMGTNPLSCAIPHGGEQMIVLDFATSKVAEGKVRHALLKGEKIPEGWIVNSAGYSTTNPEELYEPPLPPDAIKIAGALLPFAEHKGYSVSLIIDILGGILSGAGGVNMKQGNNGLFILTINPEAFISRSEFKEKVDQLVRTIKSSPRAQGVKDILIPGELEAIESERRRKNGIPIPEDVWDNLRMLYRKYGLKMPEIE
jgi:LDH2 family malate/lactate/ureidoglycolate dehydrogenase